MRLLTWDEVEGLTDCRNAEAARRIRSQIDGPPSRSLHVGRIQGHPASVVDAVVGSLENQGAGAFEGILPTRRCHRILRRQQLPRMQIVRQSRTLVCGIRWRHKITRNRFP